MYSILNSVSVPYFSGFMVIQRGLAGAFPELWRFSPLFFGVYGDTSNQYRHIIILAPVSVPYFSGFMVIPNQSTQLIKDAIGFQSPIFRGLWWYNDPHFWKWSDYWRFSPLFFGVYGDTFANRGLVLGALPCFSPLFFGVYGDTNCRQWRWCINFWMFQSPIFRGLWWYSAPWWVLK